MKRTILPLAAAMLLMATEASAFCGFFVCKANTKLFNETSQVILARDGQNTVVTMSNDFKGEVKDFAMVVPVPVILKEKDIHVVDASLFQRLDDYSAPRLAEYHDPDPCPKPMPATITCFGGANLSFAPSSTGSFSYAFNATVDLGVTVEAEYEVGEYDILILSAKESTGLKKWLNLNNYTIPADAEEVLDPYIKSNMKFFVAKVSTDRLDKTKVTDGGYQELSPIQISYESQRFMLPIRLGMANAENAQDLVIYTFTKNGRVESTNYRTVEPPTNNEIPTFIKNPELFGYFYHDVFKTAYRRQGKKSVMLEYAWDISGSQWQHCDPCVSSPPNAQDLVTAGVKWVTPSYNAYSGDLFFTRLHVRYDRLHFPQDLQFQETPNKERFQCRYVIRNPYTGDCSCDKGQEYLKTLAQRRVAEMDELVRLTRWNTDRWSDYVDEYSEYLPDDQTQVIGANEVIQDASLDGDSNARHWLWVLVAIALGLAGREVYARVVARSPGPR